MLSQDNVYEQFITDLRELFEEEGLRILETYVKEIEGFSYNSNLDIRTVNTILQGIHDFIIEYKEDMEIRAKISFNDTLKIIERIGSPSEVTEPYAHDQNKLQTQGEIIGLEPYRSRTFRDALIEHPYGIAIVLTYFSLVLIDIAWEYNKSSTRSFSDVLTSSLWNMIFVSIVVGIILGWLLRKIVGEDTSMKKKFEQLRDEYQTGAIISMIASLSLLGPLLGLLSITAGDLDNEGILGFFGVLIPIYGVISTIVLVDALSSEPETTEYGYFQLLNIKPKADREIRENIISKWKHVALPLVVFPIIWAIFIYPLLGAPTNPINVVLSSAVIYVYFFDIIGGVIAIEGYGWSNYKKIIDRQTTPN